MRHGLSSSLLAHPVADRPDVGVVVKAGPRLDVAQPVPYAATISTLYKLAHGNGTGLQERNLQSPAEPEQCCVRALHGGVAEESAGADACAAIAESLVSQCTDIHPQCNNMRAPTASTP